jgi:aryl-alcohol dehydrogenase-like predicted oxidoreductase
VSAFYQEQAAARTERIKELAHAADPDWQARTLSQTAVRALRATHGVGVVLVGMRYQAYVQDILHDLRRPVTPEERIDSWMQLVTAQKAPQ